MNKNILIGMACLAMVVMVTLPFAEAASLQGMTLQEFMTKYIFSKTSLVPYKTISSSNNAPVAVIKSRFIKKTAPAIVKFDASGSYDSDGTIVSYSWDFGDNRKSSSKRPTHIFLTFKERTYTVKLIVKDNKGKATTITETIHVSSVFSSKKSSGSDDKEEDTPDSPSNKAPVAKLEFKKVNKNVPMIVKFYSKDSYDPDGKIKSYYWDFGDGKRSWSQNPVHVYSKEGEYTVTLTVTDNDGKVSKTTKKIMVTLGPYPPEGFNCNILGTGVGGQEYTCWCYAGVDPFGHKVRVQFAWGDGTPTGITGWVDGGDYVVLNHTWPKTNDLVTYNVAVRTWDQSNATSIWVNKTYSMSKSKSKSSEKSLPIPKPIIINKPKETINHPSSNTAPVTSLISSSVSGKAPFIVKFDASGSYDSDGIIKSYYWDFGDGRRSWTKSPTHVYFKSGVYTAKLTVTDNKGEKTTAKIMISGL